MTLSPLPPLPDINDVPPVGPDDQACFDEVREVLKRHDALQRFGLTLLHQHFGIAEDEVLVESIDVENRILTTRPLATAAALRSRETSWRLDDPEGVQRCETRCVTERDWQGNEFHNRKHYTTG